MGYTPDHLTDKIKWIETDTKNARNNLVDLIYRESDLNSYYSVEYITFLEESLTSLNNILKKL